MSDITEVKAYRDMNGVIHETQKQAALADLEIRVTDIIRSTRAPHANFHTLITDFIKDNPDLLYLNLTLYMEEKGEEKIP